jgi:alpha-tubulin suppressor-like RCC1 family protein
MQLLCENVARADGVLSNLPGTLVAWGESGNGQTNVPINLSEVSDLAGGLEHSLALRNDGTVVGWGKNTFGQVTVPADLIDVTAIAAGQIHSLALKRDGTVVGWGYYVATPPADLTNVVAIAAGWDFSLAVKHDGTVATWGEYSDLFTAVVPENLSNVVAAAAGFYHGLALRKDGTVVGWPSDVAGAQVPGGLTNVIAIAAGGFHSLALRQDGTVVTWGYGDATLLTVPAEATNICAIAACGGGGAHSLALRRDGTIVAWGANGSGQSSVPPGLTNVVGIGAGGSHSLALVGPAIRAQIHDIGVYETQPVLFTAEGVGRGPFEFQWQKNGTPLTGETNNTLIVPNLQIADGGDYRVVLYSAFGSITSSTAHLRVIPAAPVIIKAPQNLMRWVGGHVLFKTEATGLSPITFQWRKEATDIAGATSSRLNLLNLRPADSGTYSIVVSNSFGSAEASAILNVQVLPENTSLVAWGNNDFGQTNPPGTLSNVVAIAAGGYHGLCLNASGTVIGWGATNYGQSKIPPGLANVIAVSAGRDHSLALLGNGTVVAWGKNDFGQTNVPPGLTNVVAISCGMDQNLAMKADGAIVAWGSNVYGESNVPLTLTNAVAIAGGWSMSMALKEDGHVVVWGVDVDRNAMITPTLSNVVEIAAGGGFAAAIDEAMHLKAWGENGIGQTNVPQSASNVLSVSAKGPHGLAIRNGGSIFCWGSDANGQSTNVPPDLSGVVGISDGLSFSLAMKAPAPAIVTQPQNALLSFGEPAVFAVSASGAGPFSYQWKKDGSALPDATNSTFTIPNVQPGDLGCYAVVVSGLGGSTQSQVVGFMSGDAQSSSPLLRIAVDLNGTILTWDCWAADYLLESALTLDPGARWTNVLTQPSLHEGRQSVSLPASNNQSFFRLRKTGF